MSNILKLGLTCPSSGKYYICKDSEFQFVGCCSTDPCANKGRCPDDKHFPSSFSPQVYSEIPPQQCDPAKPKGLWYSCTGTSPPFLGCCASNPCQQGRCPTKDLVQGKLSNITANAAVFLDGDTPSTPTPTPSQPPAQAGGLSQPAIIGISVGGALVLVFILGALLQFCRLKRRSNRPAGGAVVMGTENPEIKHLSPSPQMSLYRG
jgi:hypothetical protein